MITPDDLMAKAERALETARINLAHGDPDAAAGRAYYAVFNAARVALARLADSAPETTKTHSGVISRFSKVFVAEGRFDVELGRAIALLERDRAVADYDGRSIHPGLAERDIELAARFMEAIRKLLAEGGSQP